MPNQGLFDLDGGDIVVYTSSFSKTVAPGLRVGYFVLPPDLHAAVEATAVSTYITPVLVGQATVFEFIRRGNFEPNLERVRTLLRTRRDAMLEALEGELGGSGAVWSWPGPMTWCSSPAPCTSWGPPGVSWSSAWVDTGAADRRGAADSLARS